MKCDRCGKETDLFTMSFFNTQQICMECDHTEQQHPKYQEAVAADTAAIKRKDYNFKGIGLPADLM